MNISKEMAKRIVKEIGSIGQMVNFIDEQGYILASTDIQRIGDFHGGAAKVIKNNLDFLIIHYDEEFAGSKKGINLPIVFENKIVGVIGITGEKEEVEKLGQVIKKMTEILIVDEFNKNRKKSDARIRERFIEEWLMNDVVSKKGQLFMQGTHLGYNMQIQRRVLIVEIDDMNIQDNNEKIQEQIDQLNRVLRRVVESKRDGIFSKTISRSICLIPKCEDESIRDFAKDLINIAKDKCNISICIGIDSYKAHTINTSYTQAQKALVASKSNNKFKVQLYSDLTFEILLEEISFGLQMEFIKKIFSGYLLREIEEEIELLERYYIFNGSLSKTADALFIHPNTLQYKLKKIKQRTGYDPRSLTHSAYFNMVISIFNANKEGFHI